jgi:hypothetical protein
MDWDPAPLYAQMHVRVACVGNCAAVHPAGARTATIRLSQLNPRHRKVRGHTITPMKLHSVRNISMNVIHTKSSIFMDIILCCPVSKRRFMLFSFCFAYFSTLKMEATCTSGISIHGVIFQNVQEFITTEVKTSDSPEINTVTCMCDYRRDIGFVDHLANYK